MPLLDTVTPTTNRLHSGPFRVLPALEGYLLHKGQ
jgi:hypothetical protein